MKNKPAIRVATVSDAAEVSRLLRSAMLTYCADSGISASMLEAMTESIDSVADRISEQTCLVAEQDGKIVGTICIKEVPNPMIYMFSDKTCEYLLNAGHSFYISRFAVKRRSTMLGKASFMILLTASPISVTNRFLSSLTTYLLAMIVVIVGAYVLGLPMPCSSRALTSELSV